MTILAALTHRGVNDYIGREDLMQYTNDMIDTMVGMIEDIEDADITFPPIDPDAEDPYAENPECISAGRWGMSSPTLPLPAH